MNDFVGQELHVNDSVAVLRYNVTSAELCKCKVIGFTNCFVMVSPIDGDSSYSFRATPRKVVKFEPKE